MNTIGSLLPQLSPVDAHEIVRKPDGRLVTAWVSQDNTGNAFGIFDPSQSDPQLRYGINPSNIRSFLAEDYTGAHATGGMDRAQELAPLVLAAVFGLTALDRDEAHDLADMDFVEGASKYVIRKAAELKIITADEAFALAHTPTVQPMKPAPDGPVAAQVGTGGGAADPLASITGLLSGIAAGVQDLQHRLAQAPTAPPTAATGAPPSNWADVLHLARTAQEDIKNMLPPGGGGRWAQQLKSLSAAVLAPASK